MVSHENLQVNKIQILGARRGETSARGRDQDRHAPTPARRAADLPHRADRRAVVPRRHALEPPSPHHQ